MTTTVQERATFLAQFQDLEKELGERDRPWLRRIRKAAIARFDALGFPGTRHEDWRFTNLSGLAKIPFQPAAEVQLNPSELTRLTGDIGDCHEFVLVNGRYEAELSNLRGLPAGVVVTNLANAMQRHAELIEPHLARHARFDDHALTALNTALFRDGTFISVAKGAVLDRPIHIVHVAQPSGESSAAHPRSLILLGAASQATIVEQFVGPDDDVYFTSAVTEIVAGDNSILDHYKLQEEGRAAFHIASTQVVMARGSNFTSHYVSLGGGLVRNEIRVLLDAEGGEATVNGLYLAGGRQHVDNFTVIDHAKPHCASHELYKGILTDHAHAVFNGKIFVRPDAQKTDAKQTNKVLLLSEDATINTKPQLEIFADDVKCTHGATVGQLDADALFYLRSRGIGKDQARSLLTFAFANDIVGRIKIAELRDRLENVLMAQRLGS